MIVAARNEADLIAATVAALRGALPGRGDLGRRRCLRATAPPRRRWRPAPQVVSRGRPHGKGANVSAAAEAALERRAGAGDRPALRRRPRRLGGGAWRRWSRRSERRRVRPRRGRLQPPARRRLRPRARLRPLGDPAPLRARDRGADLRPAGDAGRGPARDAALRPRLRDGDRDDGRRGSRRLSARASTSSTSSTARAVATCAASSTAAASSPTSPAPSLRRRGAPSRRGRSRTRRSRGAISRQLPRAGRRRSRAG